MCVCVCACVCVQGYTKLHIILATPLFFGFAHLHHLRELVQHQKLDPAQAIAMVRNVRFACAQMCVCVPVQHVCVHKCVCVPVRC